MNIRRCRFALALLFAAYLVLGFCVPTSLAYIATESGSVVNSFFSSEFELDARQVEIFVEKTIKSTGLESIGPEGFSFSLICNETGESLQMTTDETGKASAMLAFTQDHLNQIYTYRLSEINDGRENVKYSEKVYEIAVAVTLDASRNIVTAATLDGKPAQQIVASFENIYVSPIRLPNTGDNSSLVLYAALLLFSGIALAMLRKRETNR